jgi:nitroreductase/NAD-dependent dihydropyrimidine dehydrogenase PreA subunit
MLFSVDEEKCLHDGICVEACGRRLIQVKGEDSFPTAVPEGEALCNDCGHCVAACPTGALSHRNMRPQDCAEIRKEWRIDSDQAEQFLRSRRSIRGYTDQVVDRDQRNKLVEIAGYAPSAHNGRPVQLLVIENSAGVKEVSGGVIDWMRGLIREAPALAESLHLERLIGFWENGRDPICRNAPHLVFAHANESSRMGDVDCVAALTYMELAAPSLGLGATWAGYVMAAMGLSPAFAATLNLPEGHQCHGVLMLGYPTVQFVRMPPRTPPAVEWR